MLHVSWVLEKHQALFRTKVDMRRSVLRFVITTWVLDYELQCLKTLEDRNALLDLINCLCNEDSHSHSHSHSQSVSQ